MKRLKIVIAALMAAGTAAAAILLPPVISEARDGLNFGTVQTEAYEPPAIQTEYTTSEKLALLCQNKNSDDSTGFMTNRQETLSSTDSVRQQVLSELQKLQKLGAFPSWLILDAEFWPAGSSALLSYTGLMERPVSLRVWNTTLFNKGDDCILAVTSDADTGLIYEYSFNYNSNSDVADTFSMDDERALHVEVSPYPFGEYLGITLAPSDAWPSPSPDYDGQTIDSLPAKYYLTEDSQIAYLFSYDDTSHFQATLFPVQAVDGAVHVDGADR